MSLCGTIAAGHDAHVYSDPARFGLEVTGTKASFRGLDYDAGVVLRYQSSRVQQAQPHTTGSFAKQIVCSMNPAIENDARTLLVRGSKI